MPNGALPKRPARPAKPTAATVPKAKEPVAARELAGRKRAARPKRPEKPKRPIPEEMTVKEKINLAAQTATARILNTTWIALFGGEIIFSPMYLNFHFVMAHIVKTDLFCKFGHEWQLGGKMKYVPGSAIMWVEIIGLFAIDLIILTIILISISQIIFIILLITDPLTAGEIFLEGVVKYFTG